MTPNNIAGMAMLNGVRVVALTDHNTSKNCPAFFEACRKYGIVPIAGMELTTAEEIHLVCLFPTLEAALDFDAYVETHRMKIKNRTDIFGEQLILDENDEVIGEDEYLLVLATDLGLTEAAKSVNDFGGIAFPAHIEKPSNSVLAILGCFPSEPKFTSAEIFNTENISKISKTYPELGSIVWIKSSDAHSLEDMPLQPSVFDGIENADETSLRERIFAHLRNNY
jgi:PHP family Zn ribbon phosphoesterase